MKRVLKANGKFVIICEDTNPEDTEKFSKNINGGLTIYSVK